MTPHSCISKPAGPGRVVDVEEEVVSLTVEVVVAAAGMVVVDIVVDAAIEVDEMGFSLPFWMQPATTAKRQIVNRTFFMGMHLNILLRVPVKNKEREEADYGSIFFFFIFSGRYSSATNSSDLDARACCSSLTPKSLIICSSAFHSFCWNHG